MGGKGAQPQNDQIVQMQMQQAAQATEANKQTQARLSQGVNEINQLFSGTPQGSSLLDLSSIANGTPYTGMLLGASTPANASGKLADGYSWGVLGDTGGATSYGIWDPQGNLVTDANSLADLSKSQIYVGGDPSKTTGGFGQDFYDKFNQAQLDYYLPQEDQQYANARTGLNYNLARAGQLNSSTAAMDIGNLASQDVTNRAQIASAADQQTAQLRSQIQQDQQTALNQLYSTENPTVAANTAGNMVANAQLTKPMLNPVGNLFTTAAVGVGNALTGFTNPYAYINPTAGGIGQTTTPGAGGTSSGASGSGSTIAG